MFTISQNFYPSTMVRVNNSCDPVILGNFKVKMKIKLKTSIPAHEYIF